MNFPQIEPCPLCNEACGINTGRGSHKLLQVACSACGYRCEYACVSADRAIEAGETDGSSYDELLDREAILSHNRLVHFAYLGRLTFEAAKREGRVAS